MILVLSGFLIGFSRSPELGWQLVFIWVAINGGLAALGALIARAHPLTVLSAVIAAPLTSLNPTIAAGMVTGLVESWLRKPRRFRSGKPAFRYHDRQGMVQKSGDPHFAGILSLQPGFRDRHLGGRVQNIRRAFVTIAATGTHFVHIGPYHIDNPLALAPMVGVTDKFFRRLCRELGAGYVVSEMLAANPALRDTLKSRRRADFDTEVSPVVIQIAGSDPAWMADAAIYNVARGAQIIDINMGCPSKKVCNKLAGSALLSNPDQVRLILDAVVQAVDVPVTLKIRTGPNPADCETVH